MVTWLKRRRQEVGIDTQEDFAALMQLEGYTITRAAISHWENGRSQPPLSDPQLRHILAKVLKLSEMELLQRSGFQLEYNLSAAGQRAAHIVDSLPAKKRRLALRLLEQLTTED